MDHTGLDLKVDVDVQVKDVVEIRPGRETRPYTAWTEWVGLSPADNLLRFDFVFPLDM